MDLKHDMFYNLCHCNIELLKDMILEFNDMTQEGQARLTESYEVVSGEYYPGLFKSIAQVRAEGIALSEIFIEALASAIALSAAGRDEEISQSIKYIHDTMPITITALLPEAQAVYQQHIVTAHKILPIEIYRLYACDTMTDAEKQEMFYWLGRAYNRS